MASACCSARVRRLPRCGRSPRACAIAGLLLEFLLSVRSIMAPTAWVAFSGFGADEFAWIDVPPGAVERLEAIFLREFGVSGVDMAWGSLITRVRRRGVREHATSRTKARSLRTGSPKVLVVLLSPADHASARCHSLARWWRQAGAAVRLSAAAGCLVMRMTSWQTDGELACCCWRDQRPPWRNHLGLIWQPGRADNQRGAVCSCDSKPDKHGVSESRIP